MSNPSFIVLPDEDRWRVALVQRQHVTARPVPGPATAQAAADALHSLGYRGEGVLLALPSALCLTTRFSTKDLPPGDRKALAYRLEEDLPLAVEELVVDFISASDAPEGGAAVAVAVRHASLLPMIDALEKAGVAIQSICPAAVLAAQFVSKGATNDACVIEFRDATAHPTADLLLVKKGVLRSWTQSCDGSGDAKLSLERVSLGVTVKPRLLALKAAGEESAEAVDPGTGLFAACRGAAEVMAGRSRPWIELRRDELAPHDSLRLYRPAIRAALASAAVLFIALSVGFLVRAHRYVQIAKSGQKELVDAYRIQFPGGGIPDHVSAVIASERRKADLLAPSHKTAAPTSALRSMEAVLSRLPEAVRFSLDRMLFEGASFEIAGRVPSYEQIDVLASSSRAAGFTVTAPEARRGTDGTWAFTLRGSGDSPVAQTPRSE